MIPCTITPTSFFRIPDKQLFVIIFLYLLCISFQLLFILNFLKNLGKLRKRYGICIQESRLDIFSRKFIFRIAPVTQTMVDKSFFCNLRFQMFQISHICIVVIFHNLLVTIEHIMPICSKNTGTSPTNDIVETSHSRNRKYIRNITWTL